MEELADRAFGLTHKEIAALVLAHVGKRENWHHLAKQPSLPYGEQKAREALEPYRHDLVDFEGLAVKWTRMGNELPQHALNRRVAELLSQDGRYFRDGQPRKVDHSRQDFEPQKPSREDQAVSDRMMASGLYAT